MDAVKLLAAHGTAARLLAGGQSLMPLLVRRIDRPALVIDVNRIEGLDQIEVLPTHIRMGALVRQEQARRSPVVRELIAGVAQALAWVANPAVRQRGTVVGNLVTNSPGAELPAVALALGAELVLRYADGEHTLPAAALLGAGKRVPANAMVTHVLWPRRCGSAGFFEVARRHGHTPVVSALVTLSRGDCRVALSGVCINGLSCTRVARVIADEFPRLPNLTDISGALMSDLTGPVYGDAYSSATYRLEVAPVVTRRAAQLMVIDATTATDGSSPGGRASSSDGSSPGGRGSSSDGSSPGGRGSSSGGSATRAQP
jgi:carbon-monoxide dehydrogenase medium subunit